MSADNSITAMYEARIREHEAALKVMRAALEAKREHLAALLLSIEADIYQIAAKATRMKADRDAIDEAKY